jgi:NADPH:quinone reductase-like Zn-dependent oxidoreductase
MKIVAVKRPVPAADEILVKVYATTSVNPAGLLHISPKYLSSLLRMHQAKTPNTISTKS